MVVSIAPPGSPTDVETAQMWSIWNADWLVRCCGKILISRTQCLDLRRRHHLDIDAELVKQVTESLRQRESVRPKEGARRSEAAVTNIKDYTCDERMLYRNVYDGVPERTVERVVLPEGVTQSLTFNGRRRTLTLRRRLIVEYHDSKAPRAYSSEK